MALNGHAAGFRLKAREPTRGSARLRPSLHPWPPHYRPHPQGVLAHSSLATGWDLTRTHRQALELSTTIPSWLMPAGAAGSPPPPPGLNSPWRRFHDRRVSSTSASLGVASAALRNPRAIDGFSSLAVTVALGGLPMAKSVHGGHIAAFRRRARGDDSPRALDAAQSQRDAWKSAAKTSALALFQETQQTCCCSSFTLRPRQFDFSCSPCLSRPLIAEVQHRCSVRDILVARRIRTDAEIAATVAASRVKSGPRAGPYPSSDLSAAPAIAAYLLYRLCGSCPELRACDGRGEVLVSAWGGAVGAPLLFALSPPVPHPAKIVQGASSPARTSPPRTTIASPISAGPGSSSSASAPISQPAWKRGAVDLAGGYNTTMDISAPRRMRRVHSSGERGATPSRRLGRKRLLTLSRQAGCRRRTAKVHSALPDKPTRTTISTRRKTAACAELAEVARLPQLNGWAKTRASDCQCLDSCPKTGRAAGGPSSTNPDIRACRSNSAQWPAWCSLDGLSLRVGGGTVARRQSGSGKRLQGGDYGHPPSTPSSPRQILTTIRLQPAWC